MKKLQVTDTRSKTASATDSYHKAFFRLTECPTVHRFVVIHTELGILYCFLEADRGDLSTYCNSSVSGTKCF
jgi:hypothetical protein